MDRFPGGFQRTKLREVAGAAAGVLVLLASGCVDDPHEITCEGERIYIVQPDDSSFHQIVRENLDPDDELHTSALVHKVEGLQGGSFSPAEDTGDTISLPTMCS